VALAASFAVDAGAQNFVIQEQSTLGDRILKEPFKLDKDGYIPLSDKPGLGVEIDEESIAQLEKNVASGAHLPVYADRDDGSFANW
jgi:galactonate dehydratase